MREGRELVSIRLMTNYLPAADKKFVFFDILVNGKMIRGQLESCGSSDLFTPMGVESRTGAKVDKTELAEVLRRLAVELEGKAE